MIKKLLKREGNWLYNYAAEILFNNVLVCTLGIY